MFVIKCSLKYCMRKLIAVYGNSSMGKSPVQYITDSQCLQYELSDLYVHVPLSPVVFPYIE